jgi:hypothetical protein
MFSILSPSSKRFVHNFRGKSSSSPSSYACYIIRRSWSVWLDPPSNNWWRVQIVKLLIPVQHKTICIFFGSTNMSRFMRGCLEALQHQMPFAHFCLLNQNLLLSWLRPWSINQYPATDLRKRISAVFSPFFCLLVSVQHYEPYRRVGIAIIL